MVLPVHQDLLALQAQVLPGQLDHQAQVAPLDPLDLQVQEPQERQVHQDLADPVDPLDLQGLRVQVDHLAHQDPLDLLDHRVQLAPVDRRDHQVLRVLKQVSSTSSLLIPQMLVADMKAC